MAVNGVQSVMMVGIYMTLAWSADSLDSHKLLKPTKALIMVKEQAGYGLMI